MIFIFKHGTGKVPIFGIWLLLWKESLRRWEYMRRNSEFSVGIKEVGNLN